SAVFTSSMRTESTLFSVLTRWRFFLEPTALRSQSKSHNSKFERGFLSERNNQGLRLKRQAKFHRYREILAVA
ncbi:hypothetical protein, partial [Nostoc sp.]